MGSGDANGDDDGDEDNDLSDSRPDAALTSATANAVDKKKKRKRSKKKTTTVIQQSSPPRIALDDLFPSKVFTEGQILPYDNDLGTVVLAKSAEKRSNDLRARLTDSAFLNNYRKAAEVHRQTRKWVQETAKPGSSLTDIAVGIEDSVRALLGNDGLDPGKGLESGMGFPTGLALNNCVAHYTPNPGQKDIVLQHEDVMKVDFGVHINGWIVDSAFTMTWDPTYDNLLAAVKDATNTGIKHAGIDVRICDVSAAIQEAMESYEVEIKGKTHPVKAVRNITGHNIDQYRIHAGKSVPFIRNSDQTKMEEGEVFAIETFGTTGRAYTKDGDGVYGYGLSYDNPGYVNLPLTSAKRLHKTIKENFGTLVFARRYLERLGCERYLAGINCLVSHGILDSYAPLMDIPGSYSAQFEHTLILKETCKEVLSRGDDY